MIYVLFEVTIKKDYMDKYFELASQLKEKLSTQKGFIRSERFSSLVNEGKLLSLSLWENEESIESWRNQMNHRMSQQQGREDIFESYTITITSLIRTYSDIKRDNAPHDSNSYFNV